MKSDHMPGHDLVEVLADIACGRGEPEELTPKLRKAMLSFGSETPDNIACMTAIEVGDTDQHRGIKFTTHAVNFVDLAWALEETDLPAPIKEAFPDMTAQDWDAFTRTTTLLYCLFNPQLRSPREA